MFFQPPIFLKNRPQKAIKNTASAEVPPSKSTGEEKIEHTEGKNHKEPGGKIGDPEFWDGGIQNWTDITIYPLKKVKLK